MAIAKQLTKRQPSAHAVQRFSKRVAITRIFVFALLSCTIGACANKNQLASQWQDYQSRLERVLQRQAEPQNDIAFPHLPKPRELSLEFSGSGIDLLDFLRMRRCALRDTIAQRNSILGRHGDAAARLIFDLRFISQAATCQKILKEDNLIALAAQLEIAAQIKQRELPARIFAASLIGPEFRQFWQMPVDLNVYPLKGKDPSLAALARWRQWQTEWLSEPEAMAAWSSIEWQQFSDTLLNTLGEIRLGAGGSMLAAQQLNVNGLISASSIIAQRVNGRPLCLKPQPIPAAEHFRGALNSVFISQLQAQASRINQHQFAVMAVVGSIEHDVLAAMTKNNLAIPPAFIEWQAQRDNLLVATTEAQRHHVALASALLSQCGLSPGN
ncbi:MAG: DUF3080 family protein [Zhongshania sp.]|uniref:DUF3080 family protein n=1 Tax=Zhongshania sp. TaxID=1971902 RepID=UPI0026350904|nr:DUF3080 family protein [Zhongshania sp.]MDF1692925.1 DUF3080 family protein [Zhongshania sp.]